MCHHKFYLIACAFVALLTPLSAPAVAAPTPADVHLLQKAVGNLEGAATVQIVSNLVVSGAGQDIVRTLQEHVVFTRKNKTLLRATTSVSGGESRVTEEYLTVGDGAHVWTVAPLDQQYAESTESDFQQPGNAGHHLGALGLLGALLAGGNGQGADVLQDFAALAEANGKSLGAATVDGKHWRGIAVTVGGSRVSLYLDPRTATFGRLTLSTQAPQLHLMVTDTMESQTTAPKLAPQAFQFAPPKGFRQVHSVSVGFLP